MDSEKRPSGPNHAPLGSRHRPEKTLLCYLEDFGNCGQETPEGSYFPENSESEDSSASFLSFVLCTTFASPVLTKPQPTSRGRVLLPNAPEQLASQFINPLFTELSATLPGAQGLSFFFFYHITSPSSVNFERLLANILGSALPALLLMLWSPEGSGARHSGSGLSLGWLGGYHPLMRPNTNPPNP